MKKQDQGKARLLYAMIPLSIVLMVFVLLVSVYVKRFDQTLMEENRSRLEEVSEHVATFLQRLVEERANLLQVVSVSTNMLQGAEARMAYLAQMEKQLGFEFIGLAGADGLLRASVFPSPENIAQEDYFQAAQAGEVPITGMTRYIFEDTAASGVIMAVPFAEDGVMVALLDMSKMASKVQMDSFNGAGYSYVMDESGNLILQARSMEYNNYLQSLKSMQLDSAYRLEDVCRGICSRGEGMFAYSDLGVEKYAYYRPLGVNHWMVVSTVPRDVVTEKTAALSKELAFLCMMAFLIFTVLFVSICTLFLRLESRRRANEAKSSFLANMSHDMRTPMNAIIGMTEIAAGHTGDPGLIQDCLRKIALSSRHLLGLINDVLDMSRIESGKLTLTQEALHLPEVVNSAVQMVYPNIRSKRQRFQLRLHQAMRENFYGDGLRLSQVMINILTNAVKFTPEEGAITVDLEALPTPIADKTCIRLTVTDTGIGMRPEFLSQLFTAFSRERDSKVDKIEGSGLGMAITKRIVDLMGGSIQVHSTEGKGTTFIVTVPLKAAPEESLRLSPCRVLLVEGDRYQREIAVASLQELGATAEGTQSLETAAACCRSAAEPFQVVIVDRALAEADGWKPFACSAKVAPVVCLSAYAWEDVRETAQKAGYQAFVQKPLFRTHLYQGLHAALCAPAPSARAAAPSLTGKRVLVVEDNEINREIAGAFLTEQGAGVVFAENGFEGVQQFQEAPEGRFDLILMDIQMPVMNGYQATREIRAQEKTGQRVPILAMSANAFQEDQIAAREAGMDGYLTKPIDLQIWVQEICRCL